MPSPYEQEQSWTAFEDTDRVFLTGSHSYRPFNVGGLGMSYWDNYGGRQPIEMSHSYGATEPIIGNRRYGGMGSLGALSQAEEGALIVIATSLGGDTQANLASLTQQYLAGDPATVNQVHTYMGVSGGSLFSVTSPSTWPWYIWAGVGIVGLMYFKR